ncbi:MAG: hypothetical protein R2812_05040 [Gelidibacter sp.]|nr:hypothetical protein [Gelidibacter sp.]
MMELVTPLNLNTDSEIVKKQMEREIQLWIEQLDYVSLEADRLAKIASNKIGDKEIRDALLDKINDNIILSNELYSHRNSLINYSECDELECDLYYIELHQKVCQKYLRHIQEYRELKEHVYLQLLM